MQHFCFAVWSPNSEVHQPPQSTSAVLFICYKPWPVDCLSFHGIWWVWTTFVQQLIRKWFLIWEKNITHDWKWGKNRREMSLSEKSKILEQSWWQWTASRTGGIGAFKMRHSLLYFSSLVPISEFCTQISRPLVYGVHISSKASVTTAWWIDPAVSNLTGLWVILCVTAGSCVDVLKARFPEGMAELLISVILLDVVQALEYLHRMGIVHR